MTMDEKWTERYGVLTGLYFTDKALNDQERVELVNIIAEYKKEKGLTWEEALKAIGQETGVLLPKKSFTSIVKSVCQTPGVAPEVVQDFCVKKETTSKEVAALERTYKERENIVASVNTSTTYNVLSTIRNFLIHPSILVAYEILKNTVVEVPVKDNEEVKIMKTSLLNLIVDQPPDAPVGIMTFINSAVLNYLKIVGINVGIYNEDRFYEVMKDATGDDVPVARMLAFKNVTIKAKHRKVGERAVA